MGWREVLALHAECEALTTESDEMPAKLGARVLSMTTELRIALARELLEGTGRVVARDVGEKLVPQWRQDACLADGWNACRAAMLKEGGG